MCALQAHQTHLWFERARRFREERRRTGRGNFVDITYRDLVRDPQSALRQILQAAELPL